MENELNGEKRGKIELTPAAEDCLEMIYRMSFGESADTNPTPVRICALAERLNVSPSSASRMAQSMALWGYLDFRRYGYITMTGDGRAHGEYLVRRHDAAARFFDRLCDGKSDVDIEKIEHYITACALEAMERELSADVTSAGEMEKT